MRKQKVIIVVITRVVEVQRFYLISSVGGSEACKEIRVAECKFSARQGLMNGMMKVREDKVQAGSSRYLVLVANLGAKLIQCKREAVPACKWFALPYNTMSRQQ
jgi:hypothetical protein